MVSPALGSRSSEWSFPLQAIGRAKSGLGTSHGPCLSAYCPHSSTCTLLRGLSWWSISLQHSLSSRFWHFFFRTDSSSHRSRIASVAVLEPLGNTGFRRVERRTIAATEYTLDLCRLSHRSKTVGEWIRRTL